MTPRLDELLKIIGPDIGCGDGPVSLSMMNIDDVFLALGARGVPEVEVTRAQMIMVALFMVANMDDPRRDRGDLNWQAFKLLREATVDMFLGVKLRLHEQG